MSTKSLFKNNGVTWTTDAAAIETEAMKAMKPIFERWTQKGYSIREIAYIINHGVFSVESEKILIGKMPPETPAK